MGVRAARGLALLGLALDDESVVQWSNVRATSFWLVAMGSSLEFASQRNPSTCFMNLRGIFPADPRTFDSVPSIQCALPPALMGIRLERSTARALFGTVTVRMPFLNVAFTAASSTSRSSVI